MVYIVKRKKGETNAVFQRTAALMINIEYGLEIYKIKNNNVCKNTPPIKKFNTVNYEFFTDNYKFNSGTIIIFTNDISNFDEEKEYTDMIYSLKAYADGLDINNANKINNVFSISDRFDSTRYTTIWENPGDISGNIHRRSILWNNGISLNQHKCYNKQNSFIWTISPIKNLSSYPQHSLDNIMQPYMYHYSLSTIIIDLDNWITCDEHMQIIPKTQMITRNHNIPLPKQLWWNEKKILLSPINISKKYGIDIEIMSVYFPILENGYDFIPLNNINIFYEHYSNLNLTPVKKASSVSNIIESDDVDGTNENKSIPDIDVNSDKYNICNKCLTPLFDEFYVIEKKSTKKQYAFCKICIHNCYTIIDIPPNQQSITLLKSKIPRNRDQVIDIMKKPSYIATEDFQFYKNMIKLIHKKFPKHPISYKDTTPICLTNEIVLIYNMPTFWRYINYIRNTKYKVIIAINIIK